MEDRIRIGDVSKRAGVTPRTVRYYESIGLIPPGEREGQGQHYYTEETVVRLRKITQLKKLGLSLDEISEVIDLYFTDPSGVQAKTKVLAILRRYLKETDEKIDAFQQFRSELQAHIMRFEQWLKGKGHH
ncbi:putative HTH-type transcriptional regulator [Pullulanibacillus camelliae]|uniref:Putative HTH-type transcriptional regulator n=1 Tax=Pullulanibacillus camelliae TaxID=1707096 RepID=A0A8J2VP93_9BACL|nr:MerR family transcriptional regulator [Pullulanibacillus camelliae]GGE32713.1 putative HTH-type transcriptional regulator [Pullulanibacillus camelliae]